VKKQLTKPVKNEEKDVVLYGELDPTNPD